MCKGINVQDQPSSLNDLWMLYTDVLYLVLVLESSEDALVLHQSPTTKKHIHLKNLNVNFNCI